jgi:hypothetical protein
MAGRLVKIIVGIVVVIAAIYLYFMADIWWAALIALVVGIALLVLGLWPAKGGAQPAMPETPATPAEPSMPGESTPTEPGREETPQPPMQ